MKLPLFYPNTFEYKRRFFQLKNRKADKKIDKLIYSCLSFLSIYSKSNKDDLFVSAHSFVMQKGTAEKLYDSYLPVYLF